MGKVSQFCSAAVNFPGPHHNNPPVCAHTFFHSANALKMLLIDCAVCNSVSILRSGDKGKQGWYIH